MIVNYVSSSNILAIGYDHIRQRLVVVFARPITAYMYKDVSPDNYSELMHAESIGAYFAKYIKNMDDIPYKKIELSTLTFREPRTDTFASFQKLSSSGV